MIIEQAWKNISKENARMLFVLVPSEPIINQVTGEEYELTSTKHLEEWFWKSMDLVDISIPQDTVPYVSMMTFQITICPLDQIKSSVE